MNKEGNPIEILNEDNQGQQFSINYIKGDATLPQASGIKIIAHVVNTYGGWGKGFVLAINKRFGKQPAKEYRLWHKQRNQNPESEDSFALGKIQTLQVEPYVYICNMVAQKGIKKQNSSQKQFIQYEELKECLIKLAQKSLQLNASIHMPKIGAGLGGGCWEEVENIILEVFKSSIEFSNIGVYVYEYDS